MKKLKSILTLTFALGFLAAVTFTSCGGKKKKVPKKPPNKQRANILLKEANIRQVTARSILLIRTTKQRTSINFSPSKRKAVKN